MNWHGHRKKLRELFCPELAKRLDVHITTYRREDDDGELPAVGRGWMTLDGREIFRVSGALAAGEHGSGAPLRQDLYQAVVSYSQLSFDDALTSESPITRAFALADRRLGKRRLSKLDLRNEHQLVQLLYRERCLIEGIEPRDDERCR